MGYSHNEWTALIIHEKMVGNWDAQSYDQKIKIKSKIIKNKTPLGLLLVWMVPCCFGWPWSVIVGGGGVKTLPFCLGSAYNICSTEDIGNSWLLC